MTAADALARARDARDAGRLEDASRLVRGHLQVRPGDATAIHLLGTIAEAARAIREAERLFRRALALDPRHDAAALSLAGLLNASGRGEEALALVSAVLARSPHHHEALALRAAMLIRQRRLDDAGAAYRTLIAHHADDWKAWMGHGHLLKALGQIGAAAAAYRQALAISPGRGIVWWALANLRAAPLDEADVGAMRTALAASSDDADRTHLHFALGHALDDPEAAFGQLRAGNALRLRHAPHDADLFSATLRKAEALYAAGILAGRAGAGHGARDPIFIVGLPRSGSTLLEQILASHPLIEGTEELHALNRVTRDMAAGRGSYLDALPLLSAGQLGAAGERYLALARPYRTTDRPYFTDKMPSNWIHAGLIRLILPRAKIIDIRRHPLACGVANYAQHFNWGNNFAYDLTAIGRFYADYVRHMAHLDRIAPGAVHRVIYEELVADPEAEIRRLFAYLGIPFDSACLRFHETERAVHTPSTGQVRRPINRDGIDRWRRYAPWLGELERALGEVLIHYPNVPPGW